MLFISMLICVCCGISAPAEGGKAEAPKQEERSVQIEVRLVQIDPTRSAETERQRGDGQDSALNSKDVVELKLVSPKVENQLGFESLLLDDGARIQIGGRTFSLADVLSLSSPKPEGGAKAEDGQGGDAASVRPDAGNAKSDRRASDLEGHLKVLAAPRLLSRIGQKAEIVMGALVPYLSQREDGCLELRHDEETQEGVSIEITAGDASDAFVTLDKCKIRVSLVASRQPIEGVPFDVGVPVMRTIEVSTSLKISTGHAAVLALPRVNDRAPLVLAVVTAQLASAASN